MASNKKYTCSFWNGITTISSEFTSLNEMAEYFREVAENVEDKFTIISGDKIYTLTPAKNLLASMAARMDWLIDLKKAGSRELVEREEYTGRNPIGLILTM